MYSIFSRTGNASGEPDGYAVGFTMGTRAGLYAAVKRLARMYSTPTGLLRRRWPSASEPVRRRGNGTDGLFRAVGLTLGRRRPRQNAVGAEMAVGDPSDSRSGYYSRFKSFHTFRLGC